MIVGGNSDLIFSLLVSQPFGEVSPLADLRAFVARTGFEPSEENFGGRGTLFDRIVSNIKF